MAEYAVNEHHVLNRIGAHIYVNFSTKVDQLQMPNERGLVSEDGLAKDFTIDPAIHYHNNYGNNPGRGGPFSGSG